MNQPDDKISWEPAQDPDLVLSSRITSAHEDATGQSAEDSLPELFQTEDADGDDLVPMLTDVLQLPRYQPDVLPATLNEVDWTALTERVRENVLERLMRKSTQMLDDQLTDSLQLVVERAMANLNAELRDTLTLMIKDIVARAVDEEINRVHTEISRRTPV